MYILMPTEFFVNVIYGDSDTLNIDNIENVEIDNGRENLKNNKVYKTEEVNKSYKNGDIYVEIDDEYVMESISKDRYYKRQKKH